ncbi:MAG: hypothetical protein Q9211_002019 [Gyalolechia sp. 1 TL-2023]
MPSTTASGTKSGIITSTDGERHIPASIRADGSTRKEIKIRPGYRPPEDVEVYKNRTAEAWKTRGVGAGVPGAAVVDHGDTEPSSNKNVKRREARKRAKAAADDSQDGIEENESTPGNGVGKSVGPDNDSWRKDEKDTAPALDVEAQKEKQARNLKKKLRQARELREKKDKGENLLPEQFAKVIKINELIRQLDSLGFDQEGEPKQ